MTKETLSELRKNLEQTRSKEAYRGMGLSNVYRRVYAMYPEGRMKIYSKENAGTVIVVVIPQRREETNVSNHSGG